MSIRISNDIFCDLCCEWIPGIVSDRVLIKRTRDVAKRLGWVSVRIKGRWKDYCPECAKKIETDTKKMKTMDASKAE